MRAVNTMKGRRPDQVGSIVTTPVHVPDVFDWSLLLPALTRGTVLAAIDLLLAAGPCGVRGPAAATVRTTWCRWTPGCGRRR